MEERETRRLALVSAAAALLVLAATAAPAGGGSVLQVAPASVTATPSDEFDPEDVTINVGETVTFTNAGGTHDVVFENGVPATIPAGMFGMESSVARTFTAAGQVRYYCSFHGTLTAGMNGTVTVTGTPQPPGPPPLPPDPGGGDGGGGTGGGGTGGGGGGTADPGSGTTGSGKSKTTISLQVSDATPERGRRVRFFGSVRPEQDGRRVQLQRRGRGGAYRTVARIRLSDTGTSRSKFSKRLRMLADGVFRARLPAYDDHQAGTSRKRKVNVS